VLLVSLHILCGLLEPWLDAAEEKKQEKANNEKRQKRVKELHENRSILAALLGLRLCQQQQELKSAWRSHWIVWLCSLESRPCENLANLTISQSSDRHRDSIRHRSIRFLCRNAIEKWPPNRGVIFQISSDRTLVNFTLSP
jgi:hypothetical protein